LRLVDALWVEWKIALRFMADNPMQTFLIALGIAVGSAVIVFVTALIGGLQSNIIERTLGTQSHIRFLPPDEINRSPVLAAGETAILRETRRAQALRAINNWQDVLAVLDQRPELSAVSPLISGPGLARRGPARDSVVLMGVEPERYQRIVRVQDNMKAGRFVVGAGQAVIGNELARALGVGVGDKLRLDAGGGRSSIVRIAGIFSLGVRELDQRYVYVDIKQAQTLLALPGAITVIDTTVKSLFDAETIAGQLGRLTSLKAESWMKTNSQLLNALSSQTMSSRMIRLFVGISVAFGIASVLAVSVVQRTREIGILRAMGSPRPQILRIFLLQGGLLGGLGALMGCAIGASLVAAFNTFGPKLFPIEVGSTLIFSTVLVATLSGVLAAAVPARRAARYDPAVAIRYV
jgi:lipoprotein-releasing system permease protein